jgi:hypothetical protein
LERELRDLERLRYLSRERDLLLSLDLERDLLLWRLLEESFSLINLFINFYKQFVVEKEF